MTAAEDSNVTADMFCCATPIAIPGMTQERCVERAWGSHGMGVFTP